METGLETYSSEWFEARKKNFTGSQAWKLICEPRTNKAKESGELSETTNTYILEKVWETLSGLNTPSIDNAATQWGVEQEPNAAKWYAKITGNDVKECGLHKIEGIKIVATPDRLVNNDGLAEFKCPYNGAIHLNHCFINSQEYFKANYKEYYWQIQSQLLLTGRKWCDFVSFDPRIDSNLGLFIFRVNANESDMELLKQKADIAHEVYKQYLNMFRTI